LNIWRMCNFSRPLWSCS